MPGTLLILTNSEDATATFVCKNLAPDSFIRLDTDTLMRTTRITYAHEPLLQTPGSTLHLRDVAAVWLRRPKPLVVSTGRNTAERRHIANEWAEAVEGFLAHIPAERWINYPARNATASHKMEQLTRARTLGLQTPDTLVTQDAQELRAFCDTHHAVIIKPLASGYLEYEDGSASIFTNRISKRDITHLPLEAAPTLFQEEIAKSADVRITVLDDHLTAVAMRKMNGTRQILDIRRDNMEGVEYERITPPPAIEQGIRALMNSYGLRFGALDFAITHAGTWIFLELNPNGQWAWLDIAGVTDIWRGFARCTT